MAASSPSGYSAIDKFVNFAVLSRVTAVFLQVVFNVLIPDHDAGVYNPPHSDEYSPDVPDHVVGFLLGGFRRWDSIYILNVAEYGYVYENALAFFPLYPILVRAVASLILFPLELFMTYQSILLIAGVLINFVLMDELATTLFKLGQKVTGNDKIAYVGALLFCINPATVFMSAPYSETLFLYISVLGMLNLENDNKLWASICFGVSGITRSNGLLNIGYLVYRLAKSSIKQIKIFKQGMFKDFETFCTSLWILFSMYFIPYACLILTALLPFMAYQYYCYVLMCTNTLDSKVNIPNHIRDYVKVRPYLKLYGEPPSPWCNDSIPLAYNYIQKNYWDQGLFNYWEWKNIPHFLLATPVVLLCLGAAVTYYKHNRYICQTLGLDDAGARKKQIPHDRSHDDGLYHLEGEKLLPYVVHALVLTVFGWFCIHVQVLTRLLFSSTPILYWYSAHLLLPDTKRQEQGNKYDLTATTSMEVEEDKNLDSKWANIVTDKICNFGKLSFHGKMILLYFLCYFVIGIALFSNFLPWT